MSMRHFLINSGFLGQQCSFWLVMGEGETVSVEVSRNGNGQIEKADESLTEKREMGKEDVVKEKEKGESTSAEKTAVIKAVGNGIGQTEDIIRTEKKDEGHNEVKETVDDDKIENVKKEEGHKQVVKADEEAHVKEGKGKEAEQVEAATLTKADRENDAVEEESEKEEQEKATETVALGKKNATFEEKSEKAGKRAEVSNYEEENPKVAEEVKQPKKRVIENRCERKAEAEKQEVGEKRTKEQVTPIAFSTYRHVRVRNSVERFVEAVEPEPIRKFRVEKGRGTTLKDIPNVKSSAKKEASRKSELKKTPMPRKATTVSSPRKHFTRSTSKHFKVESSRVQTLVVCSSKEKDVETAKRKRSAPLKFASYVSTSKEKAGKKLVKGKDVRSKGVNPSEEELRCTIAQILHEVDFNTATFILKKLAAHYDMDFVPRKGELKRITKKELMKLGDDEEEETEEEDEGESVKEDAPKPAVKRMKT